MTFSFGSNPVYVDEGQTIRLRFKAPSAWNTTQTVTVQIGDQTTLWYIVTIPEDFAPDGFPFTDLEEVETNTLYYWADGSRAGEQLITVSGLTTNTEAPIALYGSYYLVSIDNFALRVKRVSQGETSFGSWTVPTSALVSNTDIIQVRLRSSQSEGARTYLSLAIGTRTERWNITTAVKPPNVPEPFPDFTDLTGQPFSTTIYSEILRVTGLNAPATVLTSSGALAGISDGNSFVTDDNNFDVMADNGTPVTFQNTTQSTVQITNGQYLQLSYTTGGVPNTSVENLLTVGEGYNLSDWTITTGNFPSIQPVAFSFPDVTDQLTDTLIESSIQPAAGITGLGATTSVQATLVSTNPGSNYLSSRVRVHRADGTITSRGTFPIDVQNGDKLQIYTKSSPNVNTVTGMVIKVGSRTISSWDITTELGADTEASYTPPSNLTGQPTSKSVSSSSIVITAINRPIEIDATGNGKISIDFATPVEGPVTFDPNQNSSFRVFLVTKSGTNQVESTTVTLGTGSGNSFSWSTTTWAQAPADPELIGTWYAKKNAKVYYDNANSANVVVESKDDGMAVGTVLSILKQSLGPNRTGSGQPWKSDTYGDLTGGLDSRYPGYLSCDGAEYQVADYLDLFLVIGNQYGGSGSWNASDNIATGNFKVPDYRNRKLAGTGRIDGNAGSSPFLPSPDPSEPGNIGGWWYIDNVDVTTGDPDGSGSGTSPFQQWIGPAGSDSNESVFFDIGTVRTVFNEPIEDDVDFTVTGNVNASIGPLIPARVNVPVHTHYMASAQTYGGFEALVPWNERIMPYSDVSLTQPYPDGDYRNILGDIATKPGPEDDDMVGRGGGQWIDARFGDEYWDNDPAGFAAEWKSIIDVYLGAEFGATMSRYFQGNISKTWTKYLEEGPQDFPGAANETFTGSKEWSHSWETETWWPHHADETMKGNYLATTGSFTPPNAVYPFTNLAQEAPPANVTKRLPGQNVAGNVTAGCVIDVEPRNVRIDAYTPQVILEDSDTTVEMHSHFLTTQIVVDATQDFSYGNVGEAGSGRLGIPNAAKQVPVGFTQADVGLALNSGTFKLNTSYKKPIPNVTFRPNKQVPLVENFHKIKYIIKAY
jgi:hypothetical protein